MWKSNILLVFPFNKNLNDKAIYLKEVKNHYFNINCRYQFLKGFYSYWKWWGCKQFIYVDLGRLWIHSKESRILRRIYVDFVYIPGYTLCKCFLEAVNFCCYYGFILYSGVSNKRTGMFINFWPIFPPVRPYLDQYVYFLWTINDFVLLQMANIHKKLYFWANDFIPICLFGAVCLFILTKFLASTLIWSSTFIRNLRVYNFWRESRIMQTLCEICVEFL